MFIILNPCAHCSIVISDLLTRVAKSVISSIDEVPIFFSSHLLNIVLCLLRCLFPLLFDSWICLQVVFVSLVIYQKMVVIVCLTAPFNIYIGQLTYKVGQLKHKLGQFYTHTGSTNRSTWSINRLNSLYNPRGIRIMMCSYISVHFIFFIILQLLESFHMQ